MEYVKIAHYIKFHQLIWRRAINRYVKKDRKYFKTDPAWTVISHLLPKIRKVVTNQIVKQEKEY